MQMAAYRLARRESTRAANAALQPWPRACHSLRAAPCLDRSGGLCTRQYQIERVLGIGFSLLGSRLTVKGFSIQQGINKVLCIEFS